ncbi:hypothetical protein F4775DRAFT_156218 [Biscogniauxia sp. FL1348]|nr:hypothetical protein F4775DRAFT_156218 [Biscogniauxia sp. FL1348]
MLCLCRSLLHLNLLPTSRARYIGGLWISRGLMVIPLGIADDDQYHFSALVGSKAVLARNNSRQGYHHINQHGSISRPSSHLKRRAFQPLLHPCTASGPRPRPPHYLSNDIV